MNIFDDIRFIYKTARDAVIKPNEDDINNDGNPPNP